MHCMEWICMLWTISKDLHVTWSLFWKLSVLSLLWLPVFLYKKSTLRCVVYSLPSGANIQRTQRKHKNFSVHWEELYVYSLWTTWLLRQVLCDLGDYVPEHVNVYNRCSPIDESIAEFSLLSVWELQKCLFVCADLILSCYDGVVSASS